MAVSGADDGEELGVPHQLGASVAIGALTSLIVGAASLVLGIVPWEQLGVTLVAVVAVLGLGFVYTRSLATAAVGARSRLVAAIAMVGFAPAIGHAAMRSLETPLGTLVADPRDATASVFVALLCFVCACSVAWWLAARPRPRVSGVLRAVGLASVVACGALLIYAGVATHPAPTPGGYADDLPVVASLPSEAIAPSDQFNEVRPLASEVGASGFALGKTCMGGMCYAHVRRDNIVRTIGPLLRDNIDLRIHHDTAVQSIVLVAGERIIATMDATLDSDEWTRPSATTVAASVSPPRSFLGLGLLALFGAILCLSWRHTLSRRIAAIAGARSATIGDNGWLLLDDGTPRRLLENDLDSGPVVLVEGDERVGGAYRGSRGVQSFSLTRGIRRELIERLALDVSVADAIVFSWVIALSAPLAVAALFGLMG